MRSGDAQHHFAKPGFCEGEGEPRGRKKGGKTMNAACYHNGDSGCRSRRDDYYMFRTTPEYTHKLYELARALGLYRNELLEEMIDLHYSEVFGNENK